MPPGVSKRPQNLKVSARAFLLQDFLSAPGFGNSINTDAWDSLRNRKVPEEEGMGGSDGEQTTEEFRKAATLEQAGTLTPNVANRALAIVLTSTPS